MSISQSLRFLNDHLLQLHARTISGHLAACLGQPSSFKDLGVVICLGSLPARALEDFPAEASRQSAAEEFIATSG